MQAQDRFANLDTSYPSTVMLENSPVRTELSVLDVGQATSAVHHKRERWPVLWDSGHWVEQLNVMTVQQATLVQIVDRYLSLVILDITQMS